MEKLLASDATLEASAIVWYEFGRGPRTPEQLAVARDLIAINRSEIKALLGRRR